MNNNKRLSLLKAVSFLLIVTVIFPGFTISTNAASQDSNNPVIMVSLGDSYASGEGIPEFYGQNKPLEEKVKDEDWLAHRSTKSWPSLLEVPNPNGQGILIMKDYKESNTDSCGVNYNLCRWYFVASSGATTQDLTHPQIKKYCKYKPFSSLTDLVTGEKELKGQLAIFDEISEHVDYVTISIGGNDVDFAEIITECALGSTYLGTSKLEEKIDALWDNMGQTREKLMQAYRDIRNKVDGQTEIFVTGYPRLLEEGGKGLFISEYEAMWVNHNVSAFNRVIQDCIGSCGVDRNKIHYVSVEEVFAGHQAYASKDPWINKIKLPAQSEDISILGKDALVSAYSMHPNEDGARAYADCVNEAIRNVNNSKTTGTLKGVVNKASDRMTAIPGAQIEAYKSGSTSPYRKTVSDARGSYSLELPGGDYEVHITKDGYIPYSTYTTVEVDTNNYVEAFLMVQGSTSESGVAKGTISNALTGRGIDGVKLTVRTGWNNVSNGSVITTSTTDSSGNYSLVLPLGNYTVNMEKAGFLSGHVNIVVQSGTTSSQNGALSPSTISGDGYTVVLTWGENPRDLDSHVEGTLSNNNTFHVYYSHKSNYDGDIEVCNLDVDDTTSYGPETITLRPTTTNPYYYYIYKYSGSGTVATSEAQIRLYKDGVLLRTFNVPTDQGDGDYWNVFAIINGRLVVKNTITSSANTTYVN